MYRRVYVEITNVCNMNCSFCHGHSRSPRKMTEDEFSLILDKLSGVTQYVYYHLMGEPLTHPELGKFLRLAAERGYKSVITTNGTLLDKRGEEILSSGVHKVSISVHSFEGENESAHAEYLEKIASFAKQAAKQGVIVVLRLWNKGFDGGKNDFVLSYLRSYFGCEWEENTRGYRIQNKLFLEWGDRFGWPDKDAPHISDNVFCYGLRDHFGILSDGTVVPCCLDSDGVISLGNIFSEDIADIISSERARAMVKGFDGRKASEELCRRCAYAQRFSL